MLHDPLAKYILLPLKSRHFIKEFEANIPNKNDYFKSHSSPMTPNHPDLLGSNWNVSGTQQSFKTESI